MKPFKISIVKWIKSRMMKEIKSEFNYGPAKISHEEIAEIKRRAITKGFVPGVEFKSTAKINLHYKGEGELVWNNLAHSLWFSKSGGCVYDGYDKSWATITKPVVTESFSGPKKEFPSYKDWEPYIISFLVAAGVVALTFYFTI